MAIPKSNHSQDEIKYSDGKWIEKTILQEIHLQQDFIEVTMLHTTLGQKFVAASGIPNSHPSGPQRRPLLHELKKNHKLTLVL